MLPLVFWAFSAMAAIVIETYDNQAAFESRLNSSSINMVDFDDIDTSTTDPVSFSSDHYLNSLGIRITGQDGQYVSRDFNFPSDFAPVSYPNMYAPGPIDLWSTSGAAGGNTTVVTFFHEGKTFLTAGFGLYFIDADWPGDGPASFAVFDKYGQMLGTTGTITTSNLQSQFAGLIAIDSATNQPTPAIFRVQIINGSGWPGNDWNEGVALDDFVFKEPSECCIAFTDISSDFWAEDCIKALYCNNVTTGYPDNTYRPSQNVQRSQMAAFIIRALFGEDFSYSSTQHFSDIPDTHWAFKYVQKMYDAGITAGYPDGTYRPSENVSRAQMASFIIKALFGDTFSYAASAHFSDVPDTHWAFKYVQKMYDEGITTGYADGTYRPTQNVSRAQMATFIGRAFLGMP